MADFLHFLGPDVSTNILSCLDDPADLVRASAVSRSWRHFVIENKFSKELCLKLFPEVSTATHAIEVDGMVSSNTSTVLEKPEKIHNVYTILAQGLSPTLRKDCIKEAISATSTDNYPEESVSNTLVPTDRVGEKASYWSSEGETDPDVPEKLTYKLISNLCFITEIDIQPFQAYFQYGFPIYSAQAVRFRMGHIKSQLKLDADHTDDCFAWTYVSPVFPMTQENCLQKFKLPEPVLCVGRFLQIELLGRVQRQEMDRKYYICVTHVQVVGRTFLPGFGVDCIDHPGKCVVKYCPEGENSGSEKEMCEEDEAASELNTYTARLIRRAGGWERVILNNLLGNVMIDSDDEMDEEELVIG